MPATTRMVFATPVPRDQFHVPDVGLIQSRSVQYEHAGLALHTRCHILPQRRRVGWLSMHQADKGSGRILSSFGAGVDPLSGNQQLDVTNVAEFWWIHTNTVCATERGLSAA